MGKRKKKLTRAEKINYSKQANKAAKNKRLVLCRSLVNPNAIRREQINGIEHIIVSSYTLPDNIVMNGVLYPADEIEAGFETLERTLAPIEHPINANGEYISASDPEAIHNFHAGAFNTNVTRENGRVHIEKYINVQEALKTDRGKRLLDRINEIETNEKPRPIHTSTGLFLTIEELKEPKTNEYDDEYTMIGKDFVFDHDAILLDSTGAATPEQGVGMAINSDGNLVSVDKVFVQNTVKAATGLPLADSQRTWSKGAALRRVREHIGATDAPNATYGRYHLWYDDQNADNFGAYKLPFVDIVDGTPRAIPSALRNAAARLGQTQGPSTAEKTRIRGIIDRYLNRIRGNQMSMSYTQMIEQLELLIRNTIAADWMHIVDVYEDKVIFETGSGYYTVPFTISGDTITLSGIPVRVEKMVKYEPTINKSKGGDHMKTMILNALTEAGIDTEGLSDEQLMEKYNELIANGPEDEDDEEETEENQDSITNAMTKAIKSLSDKVEAISDKINANSDKEKTDLITTIVNSKKYPGMKEPALKLLPVETLKEMAANCTESHGLPFDINSDDKMNAFSAPADMPE